MPDRVRQLLIRSNTRYNDYYWDNRYKEFPGDKVIGIYSKTYVIPYFEACLVSVTDKNGIVTSYPFFQEDKAWGLYDLVFEVIRGVMNPETKYVELVGQYDHMKHTCMSVKQIQSVTMDPHLVSVSNYKGYGLQQYLDLLEHGEIEDGD